MTYEYDALGRVVEVRHNGGPNNNVEVKYQYDPAGNRTQDSVTGENHPPVANADAQLALRDTPTSFDPRGNDTDPNGGDTLTITAVTQPAHGTASFAGTALTYTPVAGYTGADSFTYTISDGRGGSSTATVTMTVQAPPAAVADGYIVQQAVPVLLPVMQNDSDPEGDPLVVQSVTQGGKGSVSISPPYVLYTSSATASGADSFTYTVSDGRGGTATATVNVVINRSPVVQADTYTVQTDGQAYALAVLGNDSDPDGDPISVQAVTQGAKGSTYVSSPNIVYTAGAGASGTDTVQYTVSDGRGGSTTGSVNIAINRPPVAVNDAANVTAGQAITVLVSSNDGDPDGDTRTIWSVTTPSKGTVSINGGALVYTANAGASGTDTFSYTIYDGRGGWATATVTMTIASVNRPPVAVNDPDVDILVGSSATVNVVANDSDPDGDPLTISSFTITSGSTKIGVTKPTPTTLRVTGKAGGSGTVSYTITDGRGGTATASFFVQVEF